LRLLHVLAFALALGEVQADSFPTIVHEPSRGVFLVANESMVDPNFARTVVLLTDHGILGSVGLIVNRDSGVPVVSTIPELKGLERRTVTLRFGGPLEIASIRLLVNSDTEIASAYKLFDGVYFINSTSLLRALLADDSAHKPTINYYAGYAAWNPGQLDSEVARGDWHIVKADPAMIFEHDPDSMWRELIEKLAGTWVLVDNASGQGHVLRPPM